MGDVKLSAAGGLNVRIFDRTKPGGDVVFDLYIDDTRKPDQGEVSARCDRKLDPANIDELHAVDDATRVGISIDLPVSRLEWRAADRFGHADSPTGDDATYPETNGGHDA